MKKSKNLFLRSFTSLFVFVHGKKNDKRILFAFTGYALEGTSHLIIY